MFTRLGRVFTGSDDVLPLVRRVPHRPQDVSHGTESADHGRLSARASYYRAPRVSCSWSRGAKVAEFRSDKASRERDGLRYRIGWRNPGLSRLAPYDAQRALALHHGSESRPEEGNSGVQRAGPKAFNRGQRPIGRYRTSGAGKAEYLRNPRSADDNATATNGCTMSETGVVLWWSRDLMAIRNGSARRKIQDVFVLQIEFRFNVQRSSACQPPKAQVTSSRHHSHRRRRRTCRILPATPRCL